MENSNILPRHTSYELQSPLMGMGAILLTKTVKNILTVHAGRLFHA